MAALSKTQRLSIIIGISCSFFLAEIAVGFYTRSLALVADAFHYLNDLVGFIVALVALKVSERDQAPSTLAFGWQRAPLLGAFFNGVFLLALGISIFLQAIERFVAIEEVQKPELVMIIGCVGFALNVLSVTILHEHDHGDQHHAQSSPSDDAAPETEIEMLQMHQAHHHVQLLQQRNKRKDQDLNILGVLLHVAGDAANNVGVIIAGAVIWKTKSSGRFYIDPAVSIAIALMIFITSLPLVKRSGMILLQSMPKDLDLANVKFDLEQIPGIIAVHELHVWRLNQQKCLASAHLVVDEPDVNKFMKIADVVNECLHAYGIHSATLQPEMHDDLQQPVAGSSATEDSSKGIRLRSTAADVCKIGCQTGKCMELSCCD